MARPLCIEFDGALHHVTSREDRDETIFEDDGDRTLFLATVAEVVQRFNWLCYAYCLMGDHYHLVVETPEGNLSKGMRQLNGVYTQASNRRHRRGGHLFQGRFKGVLVDRDNYLMQLARHVVLNPVRADLVRRPDQWRWSSYRAGAGEACGPRWLAADALLTRLGRRRTDARRRYREFVREGMGGESIWDGLRQQIFLGDDDFVTRMQSKAMVQGDTLSIPKTQRRRAPPSLKKITTKFRERNEAIVAAYGTGAYSYREIAEFFGLHLASVGRIIRKSMRQGGN